MSVLAPRVTADVRLLTATKEMQRYEQVDCPVTHLFAHGMYARRAFVPAGSLVVSKVHKTEHFYVVLSGRISVRIGEDLQEYGAGHMGVTKPGTQRMLLAIEDTTWVTFHPNPENLDSLKSLEEMIIESNPIPVLCPGSQPLLQ